jgi:3-dehydroquinate synthase
VEPLKIVSLEKNYFRSESYESSLSDSSPIYFGNQILLHLESHVATLNPDLIFVITDDKVARLYGPTIKNILADYKLHIVNFISGENNKTFTVLEDLANKVLELGASKKSLILTLGGGISMNLGGMLGSLLYRGIRFAHIPTNFMGQTDVVLSNKQGVNTFGGKNLLGMYSAPEFSLVDTSFLQTEPARFRNAGIAESLKNALIFESGFFDYMVETLKNPLDESKLHELVRLSFEQKLEICKRDPTEKELGLSLEYGHTIGHAIEILSNGALLHGEAIYIGMLIAADIALELGIMNKSEHRKHQEFLRSHPLPTKIPEFIKLDKIIETLRKDNKKMGHETGFILLKKIGHLHKIGGQLQTIVPKETIASCIKPYLSNDNSSSQK